jgi:hypothetical protein
MKRIIAISLFFFTFGYSFYAQCGINYKELLNKYCNGVYFQHQEFNRILGKEISFLFKKDNRYALYLLNPDKAFPDYTLQTNGKSKISDVVTTVNKKEKVLTYIFTAGENGEYTFSYNFGTSGESCVLLAIYLQNSSLYKQGIYKNFEELKYNNPSVSLDGRIITRTAEAGSKKVICYRLEKNKSMQQAHGKLYGFSDGRNIYIKRASATGEHVKIDNYGKYGYFEDIAYSSTGTVTVPFLTLNLIDMNSGEISRIDRKHLRELLEDEPGLLVAYNEESQKDKNIKKYLIMYLEKKSGITQPSITD